MKSNMMNIYLPNVLFLNIPSNNLFNSSAMDEISCLITASPFSEVLVIIIPPIVFRLSKSNSPCALLFKRFSNGVIAFSMANLSLSGRSFNDGILSRDLFKKLYNSSYASLYVLWSLYCCSRSLSNF